MYYSTVIFEVFFFFFFLGIERNMKSKNLITQLADFNIFYGDM